MPEHILMDAAAIGRTLTRLSHEVVEKAKGTDGLCLIGIPRRGEIVASRIRALIEKFYGAALPCAGIDIGMYRDDLVSGYFVPDARVNALGFSVDGKTVILCDDVLHTGRTVRAAIEAVSNGARAARIQLAVLIDRGHREIPIRPDYIGKNLPTSREERVSVRLTEVDGEDNVVILSNRG